MFKVMLIAALVALVPAIGAISYCPNSCTCDDDKLHVTCGEGELDVLPIALNPSIRRLVIKFHRIRSIDSSIQFYTELTMLDLSYNHLLNIPEQIFMYQKKLLQLHLNNNKIGVLSNKTFAGMTELRVLNLRGNFIDQITGEMFKALPMLEELNLGGNRIGQLDPKAFDGLTELRILYLDDNAIKTIPTLSLTPLKTLAELYMGTNSLHKIQPGAFEGLQSLRRLDIHGSMLVNISVDTFRGLESIHSLDLSDNHLLKVPTVQLSTLKRLEELTIGQNDFESIPEGAFFGLSNLKSVDISGALNLKRIQAGAFSANPNLETLVIASNKELAEIEEGAFSGLPHIKNANLRDNKIGTFREELLPWKHLNSFDLSENPLACDCQMLWLRNLIHRRNIETEEAQFLCVYPERLHGEPLRDVSAEMLGCQHLQSKERAIFGAIIVASAATVTTFVLIVYRLRHRILDTIRRHWRTSKRDTLQEEKDMEIQKSLGDGGEYHQPHCNIYTYNYHPVFRNHQHPSSMYAGQYTLSFPHYQSNHQVNQHHQQQQPLPQTPSSTLSHPTSSSSLGTGPASSTVIYSPQYAHHIYEVPKNVSDT
ncbi:insulin-like growth factor-binding protein complex acid labile subunit [Toxorhynchites rutilus septentrionalis]|uniref:insulin-like growth factor-binding protein complex acid labile subunit n=1 Tax=Toxorhynchites rutilus septentrionalis TaxID=329112 RepID=UPI00247AA041|nr:insulin-like growth factor-binding protein complex acid labile subunit [Toxorhynchites rutilus septentrionalis]